VLNIARRWYCHTGNCSRSSWAGGHHRLAGLLPAPEGQVSPVVALGTAE